MLTSSLQARAGLKGLAIPLNIQHGVFGLFSNSSMPKLLLQCPIILRRNSFSLVVANKSRESANVGTRCKALRAKQRGVLNLQTTITAVLAKGCTQHVNSLSYFRDARVDCYEAATLASAQPDQITATAVDLTVSHDFMHRASAGAAAVQVVDLGEVYVDLEGFRDGIQRQHVEDASSTNSIEDGAADGIELKQLEQVAKEEEAGLELISADNKTTEVVGTDDSDKSEAEKEAEKALAEKEALRRSRISKANKGKSAWNKGRAWSAEMKEIIKKKTKEAMTKPEILEKLRISGRKCHHSVETKAKIMNSLSIRWQAKGEQKARERACLSEWKNAVAEAARVGLTGDMELRFPKSKGRIQYVMPDGGSVSATAARKRAPLTEEGKEAQRARRALKRSEEHKKKISEAIKAKWTDEVRPPPPVPHFPNPPPPPIRRPLPGTLALPGACAACLAARVVAHSATSRTALTREAL
eukprot:jgi/Mesen1/6218/ME000320S05420